jgi:hypothetical protein
VCPAYDASRFGADTPTVLAASVGSMQGSFAVSNDGNAQYTIPLVAPPGRGGMEPDLAVSYSSAAVKSAYGTAWSQPAIIRIGAGGRRKGDIPRMAERLAS